MKTAVTGSAGFIGGRVVDELVVRGYEVTGVDRRPRPDSPGYRHTCVDLTDISRCQHLIGFLPQTDLHALVRRQVDPTLPLPAQAGR